MSVAIKVALPDVSPASGGAIGLGRLGVDIEEHLAKSKDRIRKLAWRYANNRHDAADVQQAIILKMIERHDAYDHEHKSGPRS